MSYPETRTGQGRQKTRDAWERDKYHGVSPCCSKPGCGHGVWDGKPLCALHIRETPSIAAVVREIDLREEEARGERRLRKESALVTDARTLLMMRGFATLKDLRGRLGCVATVARRATEFLVEDGVAHWDRTEGTKGRSHVIVVWDGPLWQEVACG